MNVFNYLDRHAAETALRRMQDAAEQAEESGRFYYAALLKDSCTSLEVLVKKIEKQMAIDEESED